MACKEKVRGTN